MTPVIALAALMLLFAFSEFIAMKTHATISSVLALAVLFLAGFWSGVLPKDIFETTGIKTFGTLIAGLLITSLATTLDFAEMKRQVKVIIISLLGLAGGTALIFAVGYAFHMFDFALAGSPIFAGGSAATLLITTALDGKGYELIITYCLGLLIFQKFVGIPIASYCLKKEARQFISQPHMSEQYSRQEHDQKKSKRKLLEIPQSQQKASTYLAKLACVAGLSYVLAGLTHGVIHFFVMCLILGAVAYYLGFLESGILQKTQSDGLIMFLVTVLIFSNLSSVTPSMIAQIILPLILFMTMGVVGVLTVSYIAGRVMRMSPYLAMALGISCTFGFPTTLVMPQEVAASVATNDTEKQAIENYLVPKMLVAGIITVTVASVLMAGAVIHYF
ncbi:hypothetical protein [Alloscardovia omnicolens]|uniref:hypothetical protein n=1 Tax=Alloscardovia omnicolens TaxID=419015 RepID=UPI003A5E83CC